MKLNNLKYYIKTYGVQVILLGYILYYIFYAQYISYRIKNCKYDIIGCKVYKVTKITKSPGFGIYYKYFINGVEFDGYDTEPATYKDDFRFFLVGKTIPILYCKSDKNIQEIILLPKDFVEYKLDYPDSLVWVKDYLK